MWNIHRYTWSLFLRIRTFILTISLWIDDICTYYQKYTDTYVHIYHYLYIYIYFSFWFILYEIYIYIYLQTIIYIYIFALTGKTYIATPLSHFALRKGFSWGGAQVTRLRPTEVGHGSRDHDDRSQLGGTGRASVIVFWGALTPRKINGWNISSWRWKEDHFPFFLWVICRFHVNLPGCSRDWWKLYISYHSRVFLISGNSFDTII